MIAICEREICRSHNLIKFESLNPLQLYESLLAKSYRISKVTGGADTYSLYGQLSRHHSRKAKVMGFDSKTTYEENL